MELTEPTVALDTLTLESALCAYLASWNAQHNDDLKVQPADAVDQNELRITLTAFDRSRPGLALLAQIRSPSSECTYFPTALSERDADLPNAYLSFSVASGYVYMSLNTVCVAAIVVTDSAAPVVSKLHELLRALDTFNAEALSHYTASCALKTQFNAVWNTFNASSELPATQKTLYAILSSDPLLVKWSVLRTGNKITIHARDRLLCKVGFVVTLAVEFNTGLRIVLGSGASISARRLLVGPQQAAIVVRHVLTAIDNFQYSLSANPLPVAFAKYNEELLNIEKLYAWSVSIDSCYMWLTLGDEVG